MVVVGLTISTQCGALESATRAAAAGTLSSATVARRGSKTTQCGTLLAPMVRTALVGTSTQRTTGAL
jgi:hypothetical protein